MSALRHENNLIANFDILLADRTLPFFTAAYQGRAVGDFRKSSDVLRIDAVLGLGIFAVAVEIILLIIVRYAQLQDQTVNGVLELISSRKEALELLKVFSVTFEYVAVAVVYAVARMLLDIFQKVAAWKGVGGKIAEGRKGGSV